MNKKSLIWSLISLLVLASLVLTACGGSATEAPAAPDAPAATEVPAENAIPAGDGSVTIFGGYGEAQATQR